MSRLAAPQVEEDRSGGVTIAVAILVRSQREAPTQRDVEHWIEEVGAVIAPVLGVDAGTPAGVSIRVTDRVGERIAKGLILDAATDCRTYFRRAKDETSTRTVAHGKTTFIWTSVILAWGLALLLKMFGRR